MAWQTRSPSEISVSVRGAIRQWLKGTDSALKNNTVTVFGKVLSLIAHEYELRAARLVLNWFMTTAKGQWLELLCAEIGIYRKQASAASGTATGTGTPLTEYPAGILFVSGSNTYLTSTAATAASDGTLTFAVIAQEKGASGNRDAGGQLQLSDAGAWPDLSDIFEVDTAGLGGGADIELDEDLRARGLQRKRNPPGAGTLDDYERYAREVPGVLNAWAFRSSNNPGTIFLFFIFAGRAGNIPTSGDVDTVQAYIDSKRLIRVDDSVAVAPVSHPVNIAISGLTTDTPETRAAIEAAISAMYLAKCKPGIASEPFTLYRAWIDEAISTATGEVSHTLVTPSANITLTGGEYPTPGTVSYS